MSLNGILSSALSALQTNQAALRTVSNNVANINTDGYVRRVVDQQAQVSGGQLTGVDIADIQRVADQFLNQEVLNAQAGSSQYGAQNDIYTQLNGLLGKPGDGSALTEPARQCLYGAWRGGPVADRRHQPERRADRVPEPGRDDLHPVEFDLRAADRRRTSRCRPRSARSTR